ncbi:MAG: ATP-binding protein [Sporichthyaceae bacterium]
MSVPSRPGDMFDREWEWGQLAAFVGDSSPGATLGVVAGRRRQGKSYLLQAMCDVTGGLYLGATEATEPESLALLAAAVAEHAGMPAPPTLTGWEQALDLVLALGRDRSIPVVLDEFPYLCAASAALPSIVARAFGPRRRERLASRTRLVLCGSAVSFMGGLLSGAAPLRGRAGLELPVRTLDHRLAAQFWDVEDPALAVRLHAVVGGTPAYRREYVRDDAPTDLADFDDWIVRAVLNPASPLFREARYLLAEEPDLRERALYHSVLAAVAGGDTTRGAIAGRIGRRDDAIRHPLVVLSDAGLIRREPDVLRPNRSRYAITEPLVSFYHAVMRPAWSRLERPGNAPAVWADARSRFESLVLGPHFERLARVWAADFAAPTTFGAAPATVGHAVVNDPARRRTWEVDVVVLDAQGSLLALGEAKWGQVMGEVQVDRLARVRELLVAQNRPGAATATLACFAGAGFTPELRRRARAEGHELVDLERLYHGG